MKQLLYVSFLFIGFLSADAQEAEVTESALVGHWQQVAVERLGKYSSENDSVVLSIFSNYRFESMRQVEDAASPDMVISGAWSLDSETKEITFSHSALRVGAVVNPEEESIVEVRMVNDSALILQTRLGSHPVFCSFRRINSSPLSDTAVVPETPAYSFTQDFWIRHSAKPEKRRLIRSNADLALYPVLSGDTTIYSASGKFRMASPDHMVLCIEEEEMELLRNGTNVESIHRFWCVEDAPCRTFSTNELELHVSTPGARSLNRVGTNLIAFGALTALVIAPLASINFRNGLFNEDRYFNLAAAGLAGVAVGISLVVFSGGKIYLLQSPDGAPDRDRWIVESNP